MAFDVRVATETGTVSGSTYERESSPKGEDWSWKIFGFRFYFGVDCSCCVGFSSVPNREIGWEERLRNDLLRMEWDLKP